MITPEKGERDIGLSTVVIDFDSTLAETHWPSNEIGEPIQTGVELLIHYYGQRNEIVIHTSRPASHAPAIWKWLTLHGLDTAVHDVVCGKPRGWLYIDDRAFNPFEAELYPQQWAPADVVDPKQEPDVVSEGRAPDATPIRVPQQPSRQVLDEQERRRQQAARRRGDDDIEWEVVG